MTIIERLYNHPKIKNVSISIEVIEPPNKLTIYLTDGKEIEVLGNIETSAMQILSEINGDDA